MGPEHSLASPFLMPSLKTVTAHLDAIGCANITEEVEAKYDSVMSGTYDGEMNEISHRYGRRIVYVIKSPKTVPIFEPWWEEEEEAQNAPLLILIVPTGSNNVEMVERHRMLVCDPSILPDSEEEIKEGIHAFTADADALS